MNSSLTVSAGSPLIGTARVPGDKSISHRAVMLGGLAIGTTQIEGLLEGEDVLATAAAFRQLGADVTRHQDGAWTVTALAWADCGNQKIFWIWAIPARRRACYWVS